MSDLTVAPANNRLAGGLVLVVIASFAFAYLQPPLYKAFCEWTGIYNIDKADDIVVNAMPGRPVTMEFDANSHGTGLRFTAMQNSLGVQTGELVRVDFRVENMRATPVTGQAIPSYGPKHAGNYVKKLDCFCFRQQVFAPGEVRVMPVVFALDRGLPDDVATVTLSYTFFEVAGGAGSGQSGTNAAAVSGSGV